MAGSVNKVILVGNLGKDPEIRHLENGATVANFSIATSENYKDRKTGEKVSQTEWHNIVVRNKAAEVCEKYLTKGDKIYIEGRIKTRKWTGEDGNDRYSTEINVNEFTFLSTKKEAGEVSSLLQANSPSTGGNPTETDDLPS